MHGAAQGYLCGCCTQDIGCKLAFCRQYRAQACVTGNSEVRSPGDNEPSSPFEHPLSRLLLAAYKRRLRASWRLRLPGWARRY